ncbi:hypothetical protein ACFX2I_024983 [Malus domestica]
MYDRWFCEFLLGHDGINNEWGDYSRYVNPGGVEMTSRLPGLVKWFYQVFVLTANDAERGLQSCVPG